LAVYAFRPFAFPSRSDDDEGNTQELAMHDAACTFFRTPLIGAIVLPFMAACLSGYTGYVHLPVAEGSPTYVAAQQAHDAFSLGDGNAEARLALSDTEEALARIQEVNQIVAPTFYF
jgi:hypothetical protein